MFSPLEASLSRQTWYRWFICHMGNFGRVLQEHKERSDSSWKWSDWLVKSEVLIRKIEMENNQRVVSYWVRSGNSDNSNVLRTTLGGGGGKQTSKCHLLPGAELFEQDITWNSSVWYFHPLLPFLFQKFFKHYLASNICQKILLLVNFSTLIFHDITYIWLFNLYTCCICIKHPISLWVSQT